MFPFGCGKQLGESFMEEGSIRQVRKKIEERQPLISGFDPLSFGYILPGAFIANNAATFADRSHMEADPLCFALAIQYLLVETSQVCLSNGGFTRIPLARVK